MTTFSRLSAVLFTSACLLTGCGDDGSSGDTGDGSTSTSGTTDPTGGSGATTDPGTTDPGSTTDESTTGSEGSTTTTDPGTSSGDEESSSSGGEPVQEWGALVRGTLFTDDLKAAQATHDAVSMGGQKAAEAAGDFGHDALLGTTLLGTTENEFLGIDQWTNLEGALAIYGDPKFQAAFGMLFGEPPSLELFAKRDDWYGWGSLEAADGGDHFFVVVRGTLAEQPDDAQALHDAVAAAGEEDAMALGDVAHVVWVGTPDDPQQFFAVDVWTDDTNIEAFYGNPKFQEAFGMLFDAPPTIGVYASTDWYQW